MYTCIFMSNSVFKSYGFLDAAVVLFGGKDTLGFEKQTRPLKTPVRNSDSSLLIDNKMVRKRKKVEVEKPWCFYCDRVFNVGPGLMIIT